MFIFDEEPDDAAHALRRASACDLEPHIESGHGHACSRSIPAELSPGEFAHAIRDVGGRRGGVKIVVIDSLNGYLNAMPEERFLTIQLHELLTYLGQQGVATILIGAHQGADRRRRCTRRSTPATWPTR